MADSPHILHALGARLREYVGDRRQAFRRAARVRAHLPVTVAPLDASEEAAGARADAPSVTGATRDLSDTGLTLLLPAVRVGKRYLTERDCYLGVRLDLPDEPVYLLAAPARFEQPDAGIDGYSFLLAARIVRMADDERARYLDYLNTLAGNERRAAERRRAGAATAAAGAGQAHVWESTPVSVAEAFDRFMRRKTRSHEF